MSIYQAMFRLPTVAEATGTPDQTIKRWLHEDRLLGAQKIAGGGGRGRPRSFQFYNVMEIALVKVLLDFGTRDASAAFAAARRFAHEGDEGRDPGFPYPDGLTLLGVGDGRAEVVNWHPNKDAWFGLRIGLGKPGAILVVEVNPIFRRVVSGLGFDPGKVVRDAYASQGDAP